jgi:CheY-like chemotaxis protein
MPQRCPASDLHTCPPALSCAGLQESPAGAPTQGKNDDEMLPHLGIGTQGDVGILLVDNHAGVRQGLRMFLQLEPAAAVIGEASTGAEALALAGNLKPDVVIMDVEMVGMDGIEVTALLVAMLPQVAVIILTMHGTPDKHARALAAGARVIVEKSRPEELGVAFRQVSGSLRLKMR